MSHGPWEGLQAVGHALKSCCSRVLVLIFFTCQAAGGADATEAALSNGESSGAPGLGGTAPAQAVTAFPGGFGGLEAFFEGVWVISESFLRFFP